MLLMVLLSVSSLSLFLFYKGHQLSLKLWASTSQLWKILISIFHLQVSTAVTSIKKVLWKHKCSWAIRWWSNQSFSTLSYVHVCSLTCILSCVLTAEVKVSELLKNTTLFVQDVERYTSFPPHILQALLDYPLPSSNMQVHHNSCIDQRGSKDVSKNHGFTQRQKLK